MKNHLKLLLLLCITHYSCKKNNIPTGGASLNIVLATEDIPSLYTYFTSTPADFYNQQTPLYSLTGMEYSVEPGISTISLVSSADTTHTLLQKSLNLSSGGIYSFYIFGNAPKFDLILLKDTIPAIIDSSSGIRFINLASGNSSFKIVQQVNDASTPDTIFLENREINKFKNHPVTPDLPGFYNFDIYDRSSGLFVTTITWYYTLHKNNTIAIFGSQDPSNPTPISFFQINNY
jgi:hypothetical protein